MKVRNRIKRNEWEISLSFWRQIRVFYIIYINIYESNSIFLILYFYDISHDMVHALLLLQTLHHYSHFPTSILFTSSAFFGGHFISLLSLMRSSLSACENPWKNSTKICTYRKESTCIKNYTIDSKSSQTTSFFIFHLIFRPQARWIQRCEKEEIVMGRGLVKNQKLCGCTTV